MKFDNTPPEWNNAGEEPTEYLKQNGFMPGYKPAAKVFNWFFALVGKCLNEIQAKLNDVEDGAQKNTITGIKGDAESSYRTGNINLTKNNIGLGNVPNVSTNNQTPTYSKATMLSELTSGEKLAVAFGKMKSIFDSVVPYEITGTISNDVFSISSSPPYEGFYFIKRTTTSTANAASILSYDSDTWTIVDREGEVSEIYSNMSYVVYVTSETDPDEPVISGKCRIFASSFEDTLKACIFDNISELYSANSYITDELNKKSKYATIVIGTSKSGYMNTDVDYLCDGTADQAEINSAISSLPECGGKIVLLEGTYNISGVINVNKDNVTIEGMGNGTVLKRMFNGEFIYITADKCEVSYLCIDGNYGTYTGTSNHSITLMDNATHCLIANNYIYNCYEGIYAAGDAFYNKIIANHVVDAANNGIILYNAKKNIVVDNTVITAKHGIAFDWYSEHNVCKGNICENSTTAGIHLQGNSTRNVISDNVVIKGDDTQYSIYLKSGYNIVANNQIPNMDYTNDGGTTNIFDNNMA